jgi:hypothetical protein
VRERFADIWPEAAGDLDDDGCADLLAPAGEQSWLFYGRREFRAEISATDADAQLKHPVVQQAWDWQSGTFSSMISGLSSDIDRDGMDDLVVTSDSPDSVGFVYGRRWSGELALERDFTIEVEQPGRQYIAGVGTADLDGDHQPEILLSISTLGLQGSEGVYVVQGEGKRLRGSRRLLATERWIVPESGRTLTGGETFLFNVGVSGDVDGDGGQEILTHLQNDAEGFPMPVHLMPSTRRSSK